MNIANATTEILGFIKTNCTELDYHDPALHELLRSALEYLSNAHNVHSIREQKEFLNSTLIPLEKSSNGKFSFVLEHDVTSTLNSSVPTIQIVAASGKFHTLIIKQQEQPLEGYSANHNVTVDGKPFQIAIAKERVRDDVDLKKEFSELHALKEECIRTNTPIVYFLGGTRQCPSSSQSKAKQIIAQTRGLESIFRTLENAFGNNIVVGTGGWAGTYEKSFGVPRMGYLRAKASGALTLTTMPHAGKYDRNQHPSYEVFCGDEWGDDSAVLAATCDASVLMLPFGTWTNIELSNLLSQRKPLAVVDNPWDPILSEGEKKRQITNAYGSYTLFVDPNEAANHVITKLEDRGFKKAKPFNFCALPSTSYAQTILEVTLKPQDMHRLRAACIEMLQNLEVVSNDEARQRLHDISQATTANNLFLMAEEYIHQLYKDRGATR